MKLNSNRARMGGGWMKTNKASMDMIESKQGLTDLGWSWMRLNETKQGFILLDQACSLVWTMWIKSEHVGFVLQMVRYCNCYRTWRNWSPLKLNMGWLVMIESEYWKQTEPSGHKLASNSIQWSSNGVRQTKRSWFQKWKVTGLIIYEGAKYNGLHFFEAVLL